MGLTHFKPDLKNNTYTESKMNQLRSSFNKRSSWGILVLALGWIYSCKHEHEVLIVPIDGIDTSGVFFNYSYLDSNYQGRFPLDISIEDFNSSDELKIGVLRDKPEQVQFISVVRREWPQDDGVVNLNDNNRVLYGYHNVDAQPIFKGVNDESLNDSAIVEFFTKAIPEKGSALKAGVYVIIDGKGECSYQSSAISDQKTIDWIKEKLNALPSFTPAIYKGDTVSVVYLIEIPVPSDL